MKEIRTQQTCSRWIFRVLIGNKDLGEMRVRRFSTVDDVQEQAKIYARNKGEQ